jgi:hypothetical protein
MPRWHLPGFAIQYLLGVVNGRLLVATHHDLRALDVQTGAVRWRQPPGGVLHCEGRGLLVGDVVLWPGAGGVRVFDTRTGEQLVEPQLLNHIMPGNLLFHRHQLFVTQADRVFAYGR